MVKIVPSYSWEEFYKGFLYDWIEALQQLNGLTVTESQPRLVWSLAIFMGSIVVFIGCALLMLLSYKDVPRRDELNALGLRNHSHSEKKHGGVVDPCYPKIPPRPMTARELFFDLQPSHFYQQMSADKTTPKEAEPSKSAGAGARSEPSAQPSVTGVPVDSSEQSSAIVVESTPLPKSSNIKSARPAKKLKESPTQNVPSAEVAVKPEEKKNILKTVERTQQSSMKAPIVPAKQQSKEKSDRKKNLGGAVQKRTSGERTKNSAENMPLLPSKNPQK